MLIRCLSFVAAFRVVWLAMAVCLPTAASASANTSGIRTASENWEAARHQVAADMEWQHWLRDETAMLDSWMSAPRDTEDQNAGWIHDFQEQNSGAFRAWTPAIECDATSARESRAWRACVALRRHRHIQMTQTAARLATLSSQSRYADWAAAQLDMYSRIVSKQRTARPDKPVLFQQGLDEANAIPALADTARLLRAVVGNERARKWCSDLLQPLAAGLVASQKHPHNIAVWYSSAAAIVGMECQDEALLAHSLRGEWSLQHLLEQGISADGFWFELSLGYQNYVIRAINEMLLAASLRGKAGQFQSIPPLVQALLAGPAQVRFSGNDTPTINDSNRYLKIPDEALLKTVRRILPTEAGTRSARQIKDWDLLLDPPGSDAPVASASEAQQSGGREIPGLKSLFLHSGSWYALLRAGQKAPFHAHQDTLSLELKHGDTWLLRNSVTPAYGSELHRKFYKLASAHNTPLVNGYGVSNWFAQPAAAQATHTGISAEFKSFQRGATVRRSLDVAGDALDDRIEFISTRPQHNSFGSLYHTDCSISRTPKPTGASVLPSTPGFEYMSASSSWDPGTADWSAVLDCGGRGFKLSVHGSAPVRVTLATAPALGPSRKRNALLVVMNSDGDASLRLRFEPASPSR